MKQETLEEFIESQPYYGTCTYEYKEGIEVGAKWQQEQDKNKYSEEEVKDLIEDWTKMANGLNLNFPKDNFNKWFEQFKNIKDETRNT